MSSDTPGESSMSSVGELVNGLLGSSLGYGIWAIPADMLADVPEQYRPGAVFQTAELEDGTKMEQQFAMGFLVEFDDKDEARALLMKSGQGNSNSLITTSVVPFGSGALVVDELRNYFNSFMFWSLLIVGTVAAVILGGIIGRTVSEGRRESAVFRAIGAKRSDIAGIYGVYALLLSARVALFAFVLGAFMALVVEFLYAREATVAAKVTYAATDTTAEFHLFGVGSIYVLTIIGIILVVGMLGAIIPIIRNARRNPINDMRDE
jgi:ABC-type antimicrobial peptide transport system permease subunit